MSTSRRLVEIVATVAVSTAMPAAVPTAFGGDEDRNPPYMIYIDPETGRYTTEDPRRKAAVTQPDRASAHIISNPETAGVVTSPPIRGIVAIVIAASVAIFAALIGRYAGRSRRVGAP